MMPFRRRKRREASSSAKLDHAPRPEQLDLAVAALNATIGDATARVTLLNERLRMLARELGADEDPNGNPHVA